jgi:preprotein translocase subunit SecA
MGVYDQWEKLVSELDEHNRAEFEKEYYEKEQAIYEAILSAPNEVIEGRFDELAQRFSMSHALFAGFMEGISTSLEAAIDVKKLRVNSRISLRVDFEKLYFNMHDARAQWLYTLPQWDGVLNEQQRRDIARAYRDSKQAKSQKVDRNAPCPCGSGKKYKKCCGLG